MIDGWFKSFVWACMIGSKLTYKRALCRWLKKWNLSTTASMTSICSLVYWPNGLSKAELLVPSRRASLPTSFPAWKTAIISSMKTEACLLRSLQVMIHACYIKMYVSIINIGIISGNDTSCSSTGFNPLDEFCSSFVRHRRYGRLDNS